MQCFVVSHPGLESIAARELSVLGVGNLAVESGGIGFEGDLRTLARVNVGMRTATRVLVRLGEFRARTFPELERHSAKLPWESFLDPAVAVHLRVTSKKSKLYHEDAIAERLLRAIEGRVGPVSVTPGRAEVDDEEHVVTELPTIQRFVVRFVRDVCTVSADSSGPLLHRRGYRLAVAKAPVRETLAAALILGSGWDGTMPLIDPFCGSGTIPIEAALIATNTAPGLSRRFSFERWPILGPTTVAAVRAEFAAARRPLTTIIAGYDRDAGAIEAAVSNATRAGFSAGITWNEQALSRLEFPASAGMVITNPPYGARIGERLSLRDLYAQLGNVLRQRGQGWRVALLAADALAEAATSLAWRQIATTSNGGLPVRISVAAIV